MMTKNLEGKVAVVTGGGGDIGGAIASLLACEGARVVVNDVSRGPDGKAAADRVVEQIRKAGGTAVPNYDSVSTMAGGEGIVSTAISNFSRIDILVNCAGNFVKRTITDITEKDWDSIIGVHLKGHFACTKAAVPHMMKQKGGRIINFSARGAFNGLGNLAYNSAKAGVMGFTTELSIELAPYNITVNAIIPSAVTQLFPVDLSKRDRHDNIPRSDPKAGGEFVAPAVAYLATDDAKDVTGRFIYASSGDICLYVHPLRLSSAHVFVRKMGGKWTVDELKSTVPGLLGLE